MPDARALRDLDSALTAATRVNEQKVSSLLNSQNRLRCENAALKRSEVERRSASHGRGAALAKAERELLEQDAILRAFYNFLGKDLARKQILTALEAGPKRIRPKTREELRWRLEDLREELAKLKVDVERRKAQRPVVTQPKPGEKENLTEEISAQKTAIQDWKKRVADLEQQGAGLQVAIASAEQVLQRGRERLDAASSPWQVSESQSAHVSASAVKEQLLTKEKEFAALHKERMNLEEKLLEQNQEVQERQQDLHRRNSELSQLRRRSDASMRQVVVVHQEEILKMRDELKAKEGNLEEVRSRRKSTTADAKGAVLDGRRRISVLEQQVEQQARHNVEELRREIAAEEKALAEEHKTILTEASRRAKEDEALNAQEQAWLKKETASFRARTAGAEVAAATVALPGGAAEATAAAAAAAEEAATKEGLSPRSAADCGVDAASAAAEDLALVQGLGTEGAAASAEEAVIAVRAAQAESSATERRARVEQRLRRHKEAADLKHQVKEALANKERLTLEKIGLEVELESQQKRCEQERLELKRHGMSQPDEIDLSCLRAELAARKELAEGALAESRRKIAEAEASLSAASEAAAEHRAAAADRRKAFELLGRPSEVPEPMSVLEEARAARLVAAESLEAVREEVERKAQYEEDLAAPASIGPSVVADSEVSEDILRFDFALDGEVLQPKVIFPPEAAGTSGRLLELLDEAEELETRNLLLTQEKRELSIRLSAAQFALRRCESRSKSRSQVPKTHRKGCPFCEHCQRET